jgi:hypothetical protein
MLEAGAEPGDVLHTVGSTQILATVTDRPSTAPRRVTRRLGVGPRFVHATQNPVGSVAVSWLLGLCFRDQWDKADFFETTLPQVIERTTRVSFDPPFLEGDGLEIEACRAAFRDLELTTDRLDLLAALIKALRQRHDEAIANLGLAGPVRRIFLETTGFPVPPHMRPAYQQSESIQRKAFIGGTGLPMIRRLLPGYDSEKVNVREDGPLRGIARLFAEPNPARPA